MDILIFGGTRYMGKHLVRALLANGHNVSIATRGIAADDFSDAVTRITADRADYSSFKHIFENKFYDVVYDSLAYCSNDVYALLDAVSCKKYIQISSASVYENWHMCMAENEFDPCIYPLTWCNREEFSYGEMKRQAECAAFQKYSHISPITIRYPFVIGTDDYTDRFYHYVDHIVNQKPTYTSTLDSQMSFIRSDEAGKFMAALATSNFSGCLNAASNQTISMREVTDYVSSKAGKALILSHDGERATYDGAASYSLDTRKAQELGDFFTPLHDWIYSLIDTLIVRAQKNV